VWDPGPIVIQAARKSGPFHIKVQRCVAAWWPIVNVSVCNLVGVEIEAPPIVRNAGEESVIWSERERNKIIQQSLNPVQRALSARTRSSYLEPSQPY